MIDFAKELNAEQLKVVEQGDGACLVLAGAGSGKTRAITYRVAYLLSKGVSPQEILLLTFTNKAAREMLERVAALVAKQSNLKSEIVNHKFEWGGTFHHIAAKLLRRYGSAIGYAPNFTILDSEDSKSMINLCLKEEQIDAKARRFPSPGALQDIISFSRNSESTIEDTLDLKHPRFLPLLPEIEAVATRYERKKKAANTMDFDDLLVHFLALLGSSTDKPRIDDGLATDTRISDVCKKLSMQFRYVLVDEYQDTNRIQASIVKTLSQHHKNILVVGDDAQSIYSFRAADIGNILNFPKEFLGARTFRLTTNYRSTPEILNLANEVIKRNKKQFKKILHAAAPHPDPCLPDRQALPPEAGEGSENLPLPLRPARHCLPQGMAGGERAGVRGAFAARPTLIPNPSAFEEAHTIAERVLEFRADGIPLQKMAVLFRAAHHAQTLEMELVKRGIPYDFRGGLRFFERAHIKDMLAFLKIVENPLDEVAWMRVLTLQVGIGDVGARDLIALITKCSRLEEIPNLEIPETLARRAGNGWQTVVRVVGRFVEIGKKDPSRLIESTIGDFYEDYLENEYPDFRERLDDVRELGEYAGHARDLSSFLAEASLSEAYGAERRTGASDERERLVLSTIHQAKGLEWDAVFVMHLVEGQFPHERALKEAGGVEEERRLFYVAVTRARKHLTLTYPIMSERAGLMSPSPFLEEIKKGLLQEIEPSEETAVLARREHGFLSAVEEI